MTIFMIVSVTCLGELMPQDRYPPCLQSHLNRRRVRAKDLLQQNTQAAANISQLATFLVILFVNFMYSIVSLSRKHTSIQCHQP